MTAVGGSGRDRAIEAAARALDPGEWWDVPVVFDALRDEVRRGAAAVLAAAVPVLLNDLADDIEKLAPYNCELRYDGSEDPNAAAYVEGIHAAHDAVRAAAAGWGQ